MVYVCVCVQNWLYRARLTCNLASAARKWYWFCCLFARSQHLVLKCEPRLMGGWIEKGPLCFCVRVSVSGVPEDCKTCKATFKKWQKLWIYNAIEIDRRENDLKRTQHKKHSLSNTVRGCVNKNSLVFAQIGWTCFINLYIHQRSSYIYIQTKTIIMDKPPISCVLCFLSCLDLRVVDRHFALFCVYWLTKSGALRKDIAASLHRIYIYIIHIIKVSYNFYAGGYDIHRNKIFCNHSRRPRTSVLSSVKAKCRQMLVAIQQREIVENIIIIIHRQLGQLHICKTHQPNKL